MPERTCLGCRKVREKTALVRLFVLNGALTADPPAYHPGRGAYVCRDEACLKEAYRKKECFARALRTKLVLPDEQELWLKIKGG